MNTPLPASAISAANNIRHEIKELMFLLVDLGDYTAEDLGYIIEEVFEALES